MVQLTRGNSPLIRLTGEEPVKVGWTHGENGERLMKRAGGLRVEGRRRRGRPRLRWEDCVTRDLEGVGGEGRMS